MRRWRSSWRPAAGDAAAAVAGSPDLRAARERRRAQVAGPDGITRTRAEVGHTRPLSTVFGPVTVSRIAYRAPGARNVHPADEELSLPAGRHSHGLARRSRLRRRAARSSRRALLSPGRPGRCCKRQGQQLTRQAAADFEDFYARHRPPPGAGPGEVLALSCDGKGIMVRPGQLRPRAARLARRSAAKQDGRLSRGEVRTRSGWPRSARSSTSFPSRAPPKTSWAPVPGRQGRRASPQMADREHHRRRRRRRGRGARQADRRDPRRERTWIALADGNKDQIRWIQAQAAARGTGITVVCTSSTSSNTYGPRPGASSPRPAPRPARGPHPRHRHLARPGPPGRRRPPRRHHRPGRPANRSQAQDRGQDRRLPRRQSPLPRLPHRPGRRVPISTGVIEGACRHLVKDRMDITGARWGISSAEAILKLRALHSQRRLRHLLDLPPRPRTPAKPPPAPHQLQTRRIRLPPEEPHPCPSSLANSGDVPPLFLFQQLRSIAANEILAPGCFQDRSGRVARRGPGAVRPV